MFEIIDNKGVIYACSDYDTALTAFNDIVEKGLESEYCTLGWEGDIKLVEVLQIFR